MFETLGGTWRRSPDLQKKASAFILSSAQWTKYACMHEHSCANVWSFLRVTLEQMTYTMSAVACTVMGCVYRYDYQL